MFHLNVPPDGPKFASKNLKTGKFHFSGLNIEAMSFYEKKEGLPYFHVENKLNLFLTVKLHEGLIKKGQEPLSSRLYCFLGSPCADCLNAEQQDCQIFHSVIDIAEIGSPINV